MSQPSKRRRQRSFAPRVPPPETAAPSRIQRPKGKLRRAATRSPPGTRPLGLPYGAGPSFELGRTAPSTVTVPTPTIVHDRWELQAHRAAASVGGGGKVDDLTDLDLESTTLREELTTESGSLRRPEGGEPLDDAARAALEDGFGRPLGHIRVHSGPEDGHLAQRLGARAFAYRHHIWLGPRERPTDIALLAHEVAHVGQQGHASPRPAIGGIAAIGPRRARPGSSRTPAGRRGLSRTAPPRPARTATVQRFDVWGAARSAGNAVASGVSSTAGAVVSGVGNAAGAVVEAAGDLMAMGRDALLGVVRRVAPDFLELFESGGIGTFLKDIVGKGVKSLFDGLTAPFRAALKFGAGLTARFSQALGWFSSVAAELARGGCSAVLSAARRVGTFFGSVFSPVIDKVRGIARKVAGFFSGIWNAVGAPVMGFLRKIGGSIWESLSGFISDVGDVIGTVRSALGGAWTRVKGWFGITAEDGTTEGGGLWNWIKDKAGGVWDGIMKMLQPVMGPLKVVGGVLLAISPAGPVLAAIRAWPYLRQAFGWLSQAWSDLNLVVRARHFFAQTVLPGVINAAESVGQALIGAADWLLGKLGSVSQGISRAAGALSGGVLAPLGRIVQFAQSKFQALVTWARGGLKAASSGLRSMLMRLVAFLGIILEGLKRLIAIAINPFGIPSFLLGSLWRLIPDCLKEPIIDFIVNLLSRILQALPPMPMLGILWPFVKAGMIGFLEKVKTFAMERKVMVSNKIAKIISGGSAAFAFGYLKGLALGVWEAVIGPFRAIADLFQLPAMVQQFLKRLNISMEEVMGAVDTAMGSLDSLLEAAQDLLQNPSKILDLLSSALEAAISAAGELGATVASKMMELFEQADEQIGELLGKLVGETIVNVLLTIFTAGGGAAASAISKVVSILGKVARQFLKVVRKILKFIPKILKYVRKMASKFTAAGSRSGGFMGRIVRFLQRLMRKLRRLFRGRGRSGRKWRKFKRRARLAMLGYRKRGARKGTIQGRLNGLRSRFLRVVGRITVKRKRRSGFYKVRVKRRGGVGRFKAEVKMDEPTRWRLGRAQVKKRLRRIRRSRRMTIGRVDRAMRGIRTRFAYSQLTTRFEREGSDFVVRGGMSPNREVAEEDAPRPRANKFSVVIPSKSSKVDPLVRKSGYSAPTAWPPETSLVRLIRTKSGKTSLYIRGHLVSGHLSGSGAPGNLTPLTRRANALMLSQMERNAKNRAKERPAKERGVYSYAVTATGQLGGRPPRRWIRIPPATHFTLMRLPVERQLVRSVTMTLTKKRYDEGAARWVNDKIIGSPSTPNLPKYPESYVPPPSRRAPGSPGTGGSSSGGGT